MEWDLPLSSPYQVSMHMCCLPNDTVVNSNGSLYHIFDGNFALENLNGPDETRRITVSQAPPCSLLTSLHTLPLLIASLLLITHVHVMCETHRQLLQDLRLSVPFSQDAMALLPTGRWYFRWGDTSTWLLAPTTGAMPINLTHEVPGHQKHWVRLQRCPSIFCRPTWHTL